MKIGIIDARSGFMDSEKNRQKIEGRLNRLGIIGASAAVDQGLLSKVDMAGGHVVRRVANYSPRDWGMSPQCHKMRRQRKLVALGIGGAKR